jgi:hypothetical protein
MPSKVDGELWQIALTGMDSLPPALVKADGDVITPER